MSNYDIIMAAEKQGLGNLLDSKMKNQRIPKYFNETYGMSYHSASTLLFLGEYPGIRKRLSVEITEEINCVHKCQVSKIYFSSVTLHNVKLKYPELKWPKFDHVIRPEQFRPAYGGGRPKKHGKTRQIYSGICMECKKTFEIDVNEHPSNLCICLTCAPNGLGFTSIKEQSGKHIRGYIAKS